MRKLVLAAAAVLGLALLGAAPASAAPVHVSIGFGFGSPGFGWGGPWGGPFWGGPFWGFRSPAFYPVGPICHRVVTLRNVGTRRHPRFIRVVSCRYW